MVVFTHWAAVILGSYRRYIKKGRGRDFFVNVHLIFSSNVPSQYYSDVFIGNCLNMLTVQDMRGERYDYHRLLSKSTKNKAQSGGKKEPLHQCEKVLFIGPHYNHRGGIASVLQMYRRYSPCFLFIPTYVNKPFPRNLLVFFRALFELCRMLITSPSIRIVHLHCSARGSFVRKSVLLLFSKLFRRKTVLHIHASDFHVFYERSWVLKPFIRFVLLSADTVVCLSDKWKQYFRKNLGIKKIVIINNIADHPQVSAKTKPAGRLVHFLFLGRIGDRKGIFDLLEVLHEHKYKLSGKYQLTIGGDGETKRLQQLIELYGLQDSIHFKGWVSGQEKTDLFRRCDVFILPSYNEGLPVSILEALTFGKAIISTDVGGIGEVVHDDYNGWLFTPGDKTRLASIIQELIEDNARLAQYGRNSLQLAKNYTPEAVFKSLSALYTNLLKNQAANTAPGK